MSKEKIENTSQEYFIFFISISSAKIYILISRGQLCKIYTQYLHSICFCVGKFLC